MSKYKIYQLIYTKLNQTDSPFARKDFHTAFYPLDFISKTELLLIENYIYIADIENFEKKQVVYFRNYQDNNYLFIIDIKLLPNEIDEFGRKGIFMAHTFIFPEELWKKNSQPSALLKYVENYKYNSRNEILNSTFINKQNGNILPIEIDINTNIIETFEPLNNENEIFLLKLFIDFFNPKNSSFKLILKAKEHIASNFFDKLICYFPISYKTGFGWDTLYDGGRIMDYLLPLAAYENRSPKGGAQIVAQYGLNRISYPAEFTKTEIIDPFFRWLFWDAVNINSFEMIEDGYNFSQFLNKKNSFEKKEFNWDITNFCSVNIKIIDTRFSSICRKEFGLVVSIFLTREMKPSEKFYYCINNKKHANLSHYFVIGLSKGIILKSSIETIIKSDTQIIKTFEILRELWKSGNIKLEDIAGLSEEELLRLNKYILKTKWRKSPMYLNIIFQNQILINYFTKKFHKPKKIIKYFTNVLKKSPSELVNLGFNRSFFKNFH